MKGYIKTRSTLASFPPVTVKWNINTVTQTALLKFTILAAREMDSIVDLTICKSSIRGKKSGNIKISVKIKHYFVIFEVLLSPRGRERKWCFDGQNMLFKAGNLLHLESRPGLMPHYTPGIGSRGFKLTCTLFLCFYCRCYYLPTSLQNNIWPTLLTLCSKYKECSTPLR